MLKPRWEVWNIKKRIPAVKLHIEDIVRGKFVKEEDGRRVFVTLNKRVVSRVRVLGTVVRKFANEDKSYGFLILDDGTETIRVKVWRENVELIEQFEEGDIVDIFGRVREFGEEIYIVPEIIVKIDDPNWEILRELEIMNDKLESLKRNGEIISEVTILEVLERLDKGEGVSIEDLARELGNPPKENLQKVLRILMNRGEIYESKPNYYRKVGAWKIDRKIRLQKIIRRSLCWIT